MIFHANLYKFLILFVFIKSNFACTYEKRYDEFDTSEQHNITKTRTVCCKGYIRNKEEHNKVICYPECKNCIQGYCLEPTKCICNDGYTGENCTESCADGKWGKNCLETCNCLNGAQCNPKTGNCICMVGWAGKNCDQNTTKERINATNWVRVDDAQEHDKILKNISNVLTKFTESVEHLHKTVADVKTSNMVDATELVELHQNENIAVVENLIEPAKLEDETDSSSMADFNTIYPPLLIGLSLLLIILSIFLTIKIRYSINTIRKIQNNPTDRFREKLKKEPASPVRYAATPIQPTPPVVVQTTALTTVAPKPLITSQVRQLPAPPSESIYDKVNEKKKRPESNSYVPMKSQPDMKTSPIDDKPVQSFIHGKPDRPAYLNLGGKSIEDSLKSLKKTPTQLEEIYEDIKPEVETEYEELGHYAKSN